eukprot:1158561-Pelagomonas_calceolata.AAC.6
MQGSHAKMLWTREGQGSQTGQHLHARPGVSPRQERALQYTSLDTVYMCYPPSMTFCSSSGFRASPLATIAIMPSISYKRQLKQGNDGTRLWGKQCGEVFNTFAAAPWWHACRRNHHAYCLTKT